MRAIIAAAGAADPPIPVVFALTRRTMGSALGRTVRATVAGFLTFEGLRDLPTVMHRLAAELRASFAARARNGMPAQPMFFSHPLATASQSAGGAYASVANAHGSSMADTGLGGIQEPPGGIQEPSGGTREPSTHIFASQASADVAQTLSAGVPARSYATHATASRGPMPRASHILSAHAAASYEPMSSAPHRHAAYAARGADNYYGPSPVTSHRAMYAGADDYYRRMPGETLRAPADASRRTMYPEADDYYARMSGASHHRAMYAGADDYGPLPSASRSLAAYAAMSDALHSRAMYAASGAEICMPSASHYDVYAGNGYFQPDAPHRAVYVDRDHYGQEVQGADALASNAPCAASGADATHGPMSGFSPSLGTHAASPYGAASGALAPYYKAISAGWMAAAGGDPAVAAAMFASTMRPSPPPPPPPHPQHYPSSHGSHPSTVGAASNAAIVAEAEASAAFLASRAARRQLVLSAEAGAWSPSAGAAPAVHAPPSTSTGGGIAAGGAGGSSADPPIGPSGPSGLRSPWHKRL